MKIQMIGTGSMISSDNPACYLIDDKIMIDMPNGIVKILKKQKLFDKIEHIFITHMHGDHIFDLPFIFLDRANQEKELNVYISRKWLSKLKKLVKLAFPRQYYKIFFDSKIKFISNSNIISIDDKCFTSFEVSHGSMKPSFGYQVCDNNKKVVTFTGDSGLCKNVIDYTKNSTYLISDCTLKIGTEKHLGVDNIETLLKENPDVIIVPSHMGITAKREVLKLKMDNLLIKEDFEVIIV